MPERIQSSALADYLRFVVLLRHPGRRFVSEFTMHYWPTYIKHKNCDTYLDALRGQVDKELALVQPCFDKYKGSQPELAVEECQGWEGLSDKEISHLLVAHISHLYSGKAIVGTKM